VIGQNVAILTPPEHASKHDEYVAAYERTGHRKIIGIGREVRAKRKDGPHPQPAQRTSVVAG
jgi:two-component system, LuxR family, sensor kinase FixL